MFADLSPLDLSWAEVDPRHHPFDRASAATLVRTLEPARHMPARPAEASDPLSRWADGVGRVWADAMTCALVARYGRWALGWRWARGEGDVDGGPVSSWCCPHHTMTDPEHTLAAVAAALVEWRDWLEQLADAFDAHPVGGTTTDDDRALWRAAVRDLIDLVVDRTECLSGWYDHCHLVLAWLLERWDVDPGVAHALVAEAIGGRFESWTEPDPAHVDDVAGRLSRSLPAGDDEPVEQPLPDHLQRWLEIREQVAWGSTGDADANVDTTPTSDAAADHIRAFDAVIDPARGRGLLAALELARADARRGAPLDVERLRRWQEHVLGVPRPPFRTGPAFAKGGRERYGIGPDTVARLDACLAQSAAGGDRPLPPAARAARAYLDVCCFHPFNDGNARSAFLTLLFVLLRDGLVPTDVRLLRGYSFAADDPRDATWLEHTIERSLART